MLCECVRLEGCVEHRDMDSSYIVWVLRPCASHVVFLHQSWLNRLVYTDGQTFLQLLAHKGPEESCKMISRTFLGALGYKPDYVVIVSEEEFGAPLTCGMNMGMAIDAAPFDVPGIRAMAEGCEGRNNFLGMRLSALCGVLADRGFFNDPKNRRYTSKIQILKADTMPATSEAQIQVS